MTEIAASFEGCDGVWRIGATWHGFRDIESLKVGDSVVGLGPVAKILPHPYGEAPDLYEVCFTRDSAVAFAAHRATLSGVRHELVLSFDPGTVLPVLVPEQEFEPKDADDLARVPDLLEMARHNVIEVESGAADAGSLAFGFNRLCDAVEILAARLFPLLAAEKPNPFAELFEREPQPGSFGPDPQRIPAYDCPGCGQRNSGWSLECGRCGHSRPEWATKR